MKRWYAWLAATVLLAALAGCARSNDMDRIKAIDAQMERDPAGALDQAEQYVAEYPKSALGWRLLGWARLEIETDDEGARDAFERALELDSADANSYVGLGIYHRRANDLDKASDMYTKAIELAPDEAEAYSSKVIIDLMRGDYSTAVADGEKAWELDPTSAIIAANLAVAYHYAGKTDLRDSMAAKAEELGYASMDSLQAIFDGTIKIGP
jgi:tetratricopeptide (TPR) repeat protein